MHKKKTKSHGPLEQALGSMAHKMPKPSLEVRASMNRYPEEGAYRKEEVKRLREEIEHIEKVLKDWDPEAVSNKALRSLKVDLASKRARIMEAEAYLDDDELGESDLKVEGKEAKV